MHKYKCVLLNILLTIGLMLSVSSLVFAAECNISSGKCNPGETITVTGDMTFEAVYTANTYTVNFNANGGSTPTASKTVTYDSTYGTLPTPTREGYTFQGWFTSASGGTKITSSTTVKITSAQTLYAHWTGNPVTVNYKIVDTNTWTYSENSDYSWMKKVINIGENLTLATNTYKADGYTHSGWSTVNSLSNSGSKVGNDGDTFAINDTNKIYSCDSNNANCTINLYTIWTAVNPEIANGNVTKNYVYSYENPQFITLSLKSGTGSSNLTWSIVSSTNNFTNYVEVQGNYLQLKSVGGRYSIPKGTYNVTLKVVDNTTGKSAQKTITVTINTFAVPVPISTETVFSYDGNSHTIVDNLADSYNDFVTKSNITATNVGEYTATYVLKDPLSVTWADGTTGNKTISWSIKKKVNQLTLSQESATIKFPQTITITVKTDNLDSLGYTVDAVDGLTFTKSGTNLKITPTKSGSYSVIIRSQSNVNYDSQVKIFTLNVLNGTMATSLNNAFTYDGSVKTFSLTTNPTSTITYSLNGTTYTSTPPSSTNVITQTVYYRATKANYTTVEGKADFIINPYTIKSTEVTWDNNTGCANDSSGVYTCAYVENTKVEPKIKVVVNGKTLNNGTDYMIGYSANMTGASYVNIIGVGNYTGKITKEFVIGEGTLSYTMYANDLRNASGTPVQFITGSSGGYIGKSVMDYSSVAQNGNIHFIVTPSNAVVRYGTQYGHYDFRMIPEYKKAGTYRIYFKISLEDYDDIEGSFDIVINRLEIEIPTAANVCMTGTEVSPTWEKYNPLYISIGGETSAVNLGTYTATFDLQDKVNTKWKGITDPSKETWAQTVEWSVDGICDISATEETYDITANYGKYCSLQMVDNITDATKQAFTRPGYIQVGWMENRDGKTTVYDLGSQVINLRDSEGQVKDLYALWQTSTYKLSIDYDGGSVQSKDYVVKLPDGSEGISSEISSNQTVVSYNAYFSLATPSKPGYTFKGWSIWNMDDSEHIIGSIVTHDETATTIESYFMNLTATADSTVYLKAIWEANELWVDNDAQTITTSPSSQLLNPVNRARNGSENYTYKIVQVNPNVEFTNGVVYSGPTYGFELNSETMQIKVPRYIARGVYVIKINVHDDFTLKEKDFYVNLTVKNPTVKIDSKVYEYSLNQNWNAWYGSAFNTSSYSAYQKICNTSNTYSKYTVNNDNNTYIGTIPVQGSRQTD